MKKLLFTLLMAIPVMFLASCHDDDDLPDVSLNMSYSGGVIGDDGAIYVPEGDTLYVDSVWVTPAPNTKEAAVLSVGYRLDGWPVANTPFVPFSCAIPTAALSQGSYTLDVIAAIIQVDKTPATGVVSRRIVITDSTSTPPATGRNIDIIKPDLTKK